MYVKDRKETHRCRVKECLIDAVCLYVCMRVSRIKQEQRD